MSLPPGRTYVRKLRARVAAGYDRTGSPLRLERALATLDVSVGLPPEAILCVRRFEDPLPGRLRSNGAPPPAAWREAVSESLRDLLVGAARPAREWVGANANVVLFADQAELLACLARDWRRGYAHDQWWWRALFPKFDLPDAVVRAWTENAQHVPAALRRLNQVNCASEFLTAIPKSSVARLLGRVLEVFGLETLRRGLMTGTQSRSSFEVPRLASTHVPAPWLRWVRVDPWLPDESRQLLMIVLMLERAPGVLRSPQFIREWDLWQSRLEEPRAEVALSPTDPMNGPADVVSAVSTRNTNQESSVEPKCAGAANSDSMRPDNVRAVRSQPSAFQREKPAYDSPATSSPLPPESADLSPDAELNSASQSRDLNEAFPEPEREVVPTEWGGVLYLVNIALALGLYGDFTRPRHAGLALPMWDLLTLLGQRMAGSESFADPLWALLARLSGRSEGEPPALGFEAPTEWRMPEDWLVGFKPSGDGRWTISGSRLRVRHPLGFLILDVPLSPETPSVQLESEMCRFPADFKSSLRQDDETMPGRINRPLDRWVNWLAPCVNARLASALGMADPTASSLLVLRERANVEVTAECLTARFRLAEHPVALRMAGLDRDPGWVPAAGRRIAFHYD